MRRRALRGGARLLEWPRFAMFWVTSVLGEKLRLRRALDVVTRKPLRAA
ncbi:MAG: hypothetical protein Q8L14_24080 [Myxococcales bacterium]|nr:hypothetical protein [Myxococcales bacterium]